MLLARSGAECHLYMALHPCDCGASEILELEHRLETRDEDLVAVYRGRCAGCGAERGFDFLLVPELPPAPPAYGGERPSAIIDAGEFLATAEAEARKVPADLEGLDEDARRQAHRRLGRAVAALDEALKLIPAGSDRVPAESITSRLGRELYEGEPGRFRRSRIEAVRGVYRESLDRLEALIGPQPERPSALPGGPGEERYFRVAGRPVRLTRLDDGGLRVETTDPETGELISKPTMLTPIVTASPEAEEIPEAAFETSLRVARAKAKRATAPSTLSPSTIDIAPLVERFAEVDLDRALGALLGLAVGDALGTTNEFKALEAPPFPRLARGPLTGIVGGGPFHLEPGQVTDDTQMALALTARLTSGEPTLSIEGLMADYAAWSKVCFDIGSQTHQAIDAAASLPALEAGRQVWEQRQGLKPAGNGSLMRTAPIGVFLARLGETRRQVSMADSATTHFDPRCQLACMVFGGAIARAVTAEVGPEEVLKTAEVELDRSAPLLRATHRDLAAPIEEAYGALESDLAAARRDDPDLYGAELHLHHMQGFVRVAFRLAFWELLHAPDYASAVIDAANRGGDADTNAAICGALYGAVAGVSAIDPGWLKAVLRAPGIGDGGREYRPEGFLRAVWRAAGRGGVAAAALAPLVAEALPAERERAEPTQRLQPRPPRNDRWEVAGGLEIDYRLRGEDRHGQYEGRHRGVRVVATSVAAPAESLPAIEAAMPPADLAGVAPLLALAPCSLEGAPRIVCIEQRPEGAPLASPGYPRAAASARSIASALGWIAAAAEQRGAVLEGIRPELVFVAGDAVTGVLPRAAIAARFLAGGGSLGLAYPFTATYVAPEILRGEAGTPASDVYSICATLYFMLARRGPYEDRGGLMDQLAAAIAGPPAEVPGAGAELAALVRAGLSPDPKARPTAAELVARL